MENFVFDNTHFRRNVHFWTDYNRVNETHFWSELENAWWNQCRSSDVPNAHFVEFAASVSIDGYKVIRNLIGRSKMGCICLGKVGLIHAQLVNQIGILSQCNTLTTIMQFTV